MNLLATANVQSAQVNQQYHIRPMQEQDIDPVLSIDRTSFALPWSANAYHYELNENLRSLLWVAETIDHESSPIVVGMIVVWMILDEAHIATIAVHPDFRGKGIGRSLLIVGLREAIRQGATHTTLEVRASNMAAQNLYRSFQFQIVGQRPQYYRDNNEDALIMTTKYLGRGYLEWLDNEGWRKESQPVRKSTSDVGV